MFRFILDVNEESFLILLMSFKKVNQYYSFFFFYLLLLLFYSHDYFDILLECTLNQALIKDKRNPKLNILAASQTKDKTILTEEGVGSVLAELKESFDYIVW